ncbi:RelA/SpoT [Penicillium angulare]|uniref:RelA/SpoT n=1 Tax=Penicillium angulare TaxID=116970 RepID=UPI002540C736|nr:RelA/SpoT [Penicillium angulare]KAJ5259312.1 RelA/SpoT [Penicillium angulare]
MSTKVSDSLVPAFVQKYCTHYKHEYNGAANAVATTCSQVFSNSGIYHAVKFRAKHPKSLETKILNLEFRQGHAYKSFEDIREEIKDFAGVRILVDFPKDMDKVGTLIKQSFMVFQEVSHPKENNSKNYHADHYHVRLHGSQGEVVVEIQVSPTVRAPYHNMEHEIIYKAKKTPTRAQCQGLEIQGGLADMSEMNLRHFAENEAHQAGKKARPLEGLNDVGHHSQKWIRQRPNEWFHSKELGLCTSIRAFLEKQDKATVGNLLEILEMTLGPDSESQYLEVACQYPNHNPDLVVFIMDRMLLTDKVQYPDFESWNNAHEAHVYKIKTLTSTIGWLSRIWKVSLEWRKIFARAHDKSSLREGLSWLGSTKQFSFLDDKILSELDANDVDILDGLWTWFEEQNDRPFMLAFAISKFELWKDRRVALPHIHDLVAALGPLMKPKQ